MTAQSDQRAHLGHAAALLFFAGLAVVWTYPLVNDPSTYILGRGTGDNVAFLWNFWWMRAALALDLPVFRTAYLFAPVGVDLTLHTHTALPALAGATVLSGQTIIAALNFTILASIFLAGASTYLLAWRITRHHLAAVLAGAIFAGSPFMSAHLNGHFNLTNAWTVPLFAYTFSEALTRRGSVWPVVAGLVLGITAYIDYYLFIYQVLLAGCLVCIRVLNVGITTASPTRRSHLVFVIAVTLIAIDGLLLLAIAVTGGFRFEALGIRISARSAFNPLQVLWVLVAVAFVARLRLRVLLRRHPSGDLRATARILFMMTAVAVICAAPLAGKGITLLTSGEYVSQRYFWRHAPKGIDLATVILGNPFNGWWGAAVQRLYAAQDLDAIDGSCWLGLVPVVLSILAVRRHRHNPVVRRWAAIGAAFLVWSLGPHLMVSGVNTGMILPQMVVRYIPILANARIPGRATVVVYLAAAILSAIYVANVQRSVGKRWTVSILLLTALLVDYLPAPFPVTALDRPAVYAMLSRRSEQGAVCELPLGIRDGFGERGSLDHRVLFYQSIHERPLLGGFVARLSPSVLDFYLNDPLLATLLRLSGDDRAPHISPPTGQLAADLLKRHGIRFVVLNRETASRELIDYVAHSLPLTPLSTDAERTLYLVP